MFKPQINNYAEFFLIVLAVGFFSMATSNQSLSFFIFPSQIVSASENICYFLGFTILFIVIPILHISKNYKKMQPTFRQAKIDELTTLWKIFEHAIKKRAEDGSSQWQDGYPSIISIENDILQGNGYVLTEDKTIIGYCSLTENEPAYDAIEGRWFKSRKDLIFHRVAISPDFLGKGFSHKILDCIEQFALSNGCDSIKADTNFDNHAMIGLFEKRNYLYCGEVYFRGSPRRAYQKILI